jgi:hypothetical protein
METIKTIADIRAVKYWGWVEPKFGPWEGKPEKYWTIVRHEIQIKDPSGKWTPVEVIDINEEGQDESQSVL